MPQASHSRERGELISVHVGQDHSPGAAFGVTCNLLAGLLAMDVGFVVSWTTGGDAADSRFVLMGLDARGIFAGSFVFCKTLEGPATVFGGFGRETG